MIDLFPHKDNIDRKISDNYKSLKCEITKFKNDFYAKMINNISNLNLNDRDEFNKFVNIINTYRKELIDFSKRHGIKSQSKFESSFLEELNSYLFAKIDKIHTGELSVFNKGIFSGVKIDNNLSLNTITKDVDFCIARKVTIQLEKNTFQNNEWRIPIISIEVKTYLDATMLGEIKSSSKTLKSASPNSMVFLLVGYKDLKDDHIIAAKHDSALDEIFVLHSKNSINIDSDALFSYYTKVKNSLYSALENHQIPIYGEQFKR